MGYLSSVCSGGQRCAGLADRNVMGFISAIHELASRERQFYCWLSSVRKLLLTPLRSKGERLSFEPLDIIDCIYYYTNKVFVCLLWSTESVCPSLGEPCTHLFFSLCESFFHLSVLIGRHSTSLTYFLHDAQGRDVTFLPLLTHIKHFLDIYKE